MNEENRKYIWKYIQKTGDHLLNKLPEHPNHPNGRNPYAHVALKVKTKFGKSYKDLSDNDLDKIKQYLDLIKKDYSKKIIYPSPDELKDHKEFLKKDLKKNFF